MIEKTAVTVDKNASASDVLGLLVSGGHVDIRSLNVSKQLQLLYYTFSRYSVLLTSLGDSFTSGDRNSRIESCIVKYCGGGVTFQRGAFRNARDRRLSDFVGFVIGRNADHASKASKQHLSTVFSFVSTVSQGGDIYLEEAIVHTTNVGDMNIKSRNSVVTKVIQIPLALLISDSRLPNPKYASQLKVISDYGLVANALDVTMMNLGNKHKASLERLKLLEACRLEMAKHLALFGVFVP